MWCLFLLFCLILNNGAAKITIKEFDVQSFTVVGIFLGGASEQKEAFNDTCRSGSMDPSIIIPNRSDSYSVWRELCQNDAVGPIAIFGPQSAISDGVVRDQCAIVQIPHVQATWQPFDPDLARISNEDTPAEESTPLPPETEDEENPEEAAPEYKRITINFHPQFDDIAIAYARLLRLYGWTKFAAFYEDDFGLLRIQKILAEHSTEYPIFVRKLDAEERENNLQLFKELKDYKVDNVLLDCHTDRIMVYMSVADQMEVTDVYHHFIFVSLDGSKHARKMQELNSNTTWLSMTEYDVLDDPQHRLAPKAQNWKQSDHAVDYQLETLLIVDMVNHLITAEKSIDNFTAPSFSICPDQEEEIEPWEHGAALQNKLLTCHLSIKHTLIWGHGSAPAKSSAKQTLPYHPLLEAFRRIFRPLFENLWIRPERRNFRHPMVTAGVTGNIQFDENGKRVNYSLYVNEIYMKKRFTNGQWRSVEPDVFLQEETDAKKNATDSSNINFRIISRRAKPYFYERVPCEGDNCTACDMLKYEGFAVDLVCEMFKIMNEEFKLNYTFVFLDDTDKKYGFYDPDKKKWTGLIGDLLDKNADLAVCDLTITEERKKVVDFSVPFMTLGISILYTADQEVEPEMFSFMNPYTFDVWMHTATAYCLVSLVLFVCARISPADWENPQPCDKDPEELENIWNFKNCTWLTMGSIMTQGCDILPKAFGSRWVCAMWWFFAVIVCQTYIAQLSASMTSALENEPINNVEDLAKQNKILYGCLAGGSTLGFFKNSNDKMYQNMYANMMANKAVLVQSNDEAERRVIKGHNKYAAFMESTTIEYKLKRECKLKKIGGLLDSKDYGIAMPANSPFRSSINRAILRLKEKTKLDQIKEKWWDRMYDAKNCTTGKDEEDVEGDLEMKNLVGAFVVLIAGMFFCLFITAAEFMDEVRNIVVREQVTHKEAFIKELKASLNFFQLQKPVQRNPSRAPSVISDGSQLEAKQERRAQAMENFMDMEKMAQ